MTNPGRAGEVAGGYGFVPGAVFRVVQGVVHAWPDTVIYRVPTHPAGRISAHAQRRLVYRWLTSIPKRLP